MVVEAATGRRELSEEELVRIAEHVARVGFDPGELIPARDRLRGLLWEGSLIYEDTLLRADIYHYLLHVRRGREWPEDTTLQDYEESIRAVIVDPESGILVNRFRDQGWQLTFLRRSGPLEGPRGNEWVLVEYNLNRDYWATAFQPVRGRAYLEEPEREDEKWLRGPEG